MEEAILINKYLVKPESLKKREYRTRTKEKKLRTTFKDCQTVDDVIYVLLEKKFRTTFKDCQTVDDVIYVLLKKK
jgi:hypothetical protein